MIPESVPRFIASVRDYGNGMVEAGISFVPVDRVVNSGNSSTQKDQTDRAVRRARATIRRRCMTMQADHLLTLTYRDNMTDWRQACLDLETFIRAIREQLGPFHYVAVAERQKRGAWHWHLGVKGFQLVAILRASWRSIVGQGNIDVRGPRARGDAVAPPAHAGAVEWQSFRLSTYLAKYLGKDIEDETRHSGEHRYRCSLGIGDPVSRVEFTCRTLDEAMHTLADRFEELGATVAFVWRAPDELPQAWMCSWG